MHDKNYDECMKPQTGDLVHLSDELVDIGFPVAEVTTPNVVLEFACPPAASWVGELEGP